MNKQLAIALKNQTCLIKNKTSERKSKKKDLIQLLIIKTNSNISTNL